MSAEVLRRAVIEIRSNYYDTDETTSFDTFMLAIADWLEGEARGIDAFHSLALDPIWEGHYSEAVDQQATALYGDALKIARAYLGELS